MKVKLEELIKVRTGKLDANAANENGQYPFFTCSKEPLSINTYSYDCECVLVAGNGDLNVKYYNGKFDAYQRTYILESNSNKLYMPYLYFFMDKYVDTLRKQSIGGVIKYIKLENITNVSIELPEIDNQKYICNKIYKVKELINKHKKIISYLDTFIKARFVEMFGDINNYKVNIDVKKFKDICTVHQGLQIPISDRKKEPGPNRYKYITIQYLNGKKEEEYIENPNNSVLCKAEDILMTRTGNTGQVVTDVEGCFHNNFFIIDYNKKELNRIFLLTFLRQKEVRDMMVKVATTSTIPDLNHDKFYEIDIPIPTIDLQNTFATFVNQVDKLKFDVQKSLEKTQMLFDSLMQEYFG